VRPLIAVAALALSGCATAQMHSDSQLNRAGEACGLALGELIQDEAEKKLLLIIRQAPTPEQRQCVTKWARANHLKAVFVAMDFAS
jgi:hypothetical protein